MPDIVNPALAGKRAVVTGAGRGIGRAISLALARAGADLAIAARTPAALDDLATEVQDLGRRALAIPCDVTDPAQVSRLAVAAIDGLGGVDVLVNNAGSAESHKVVDHPDDVWHRMLAVNLTSVFYVTRAFAPAMVDHRGGRIINVTSVASKVGGRYIAAYTAAKHGALGLTRALAVELLPYGITVNAICPGYVDTPMTDANVANMSSLTGRPPEQIRATLEQSNPQRRLIEPAEVAAVAVFLALDTSKGITGQAINVDGGAVMW
jgi:NAD(P)-dependent dehydrogenase (short-subunit alcohol dehydrogenase family)